MRDIDSIAAIVEKMPDSTLKGNLCSVLGAHFTSPESELHLAQILEEFVSNQLAAIRS